MKGTVVEVSAWGGRNRESWNRTALGCSYESRAHIRARVWTISRNAAVVKIYKELVHTSVPFN